MQELHPGSKVQRHFYCGNCQFRKINSLLKSEFIGFVDSIPPNYSKTLMLKPFCYSLQYPEHLNDWKRGSNNVSNIYHSPLLILIGLELPSYYRVLCNRNAFFFTTQNKIEIFYSQNSYSQTYLAYSDIHNILKGSRESDFKDYSDLISILSLSIPSICI